MDNRKTQSGVSDNKHALVEILPDKLPRGNLGCAYEAAVVFPERVSRPASTGGR